ncbi:hypothetical protein ABPG75_013229 [Micractinium tetrahymenae]
MQNCTRCDAGGRCAAGACAAGFRRTSSGRCTSCSVVGCAFCPKSRSQCESCLPGYWRSSAGECQGPCQANCDTCASASACAPGGCGPGYGLVGGRCLPCADSVCRRCDGAVDRCQHCGDEDVVQTTPEGRCVSWWDA